MTQIRFAAICFLCCSIMVSLPSCGLLKTTPDAPEVFDNDFKESFAKDYRRAEPNLMYAAANITDTEVYIEAELSQELSGGHYDLAEIKNVRDHQFVAAVKRRAIIGSGSECSLSVYSHGRLPPALQSWTIKSVSVLALQTNEFATIRFYGENKEQEAQSFATNPLQYHMDHGAVELAVFEGAEYQDQLQSLGNSNQTKKVYASADISVQPLSVYTDDVADNSMKCFILVRFEETDNLIWVARLYSDKEGNKLYMDFSEYTDYESVRLAELEVTFTELILARINSQDVK